MATAFGQFLEFSLPSADVRASLDFYRRLGFSELPVGDIRDYHYGVVSDGRIALGLHGAGVDEPALSFVRTGVADALPAPLLAEDSLRFTRLGHESFHEIGMQSPDGHLLVMMEARTFSRANLSELPAPLIGRIAEISLGCRDPTASLDFWTRAGWTAGNEPGDDAGEPVELLAPGLRLGLRTELPPGRTALRFAPEDPADVAATLERLEIPLRRTGDRLVVVAPEGTRIELVAPESA